jgi:uncharacterized protein YraI
MNRKISFVTAAVVGCLALPAVAAAQTAVVTTDLNMREGPGPNYAVITAMPQGEAVEIEGCLETMSWCQVSWDGETGWAYADYLAMELEGSRMVVREARPRVAIPIVSDVVGAVGQTVGTIVGGTVEALTAPISPPERVRTYVVEERIDPVLLDGEVVVGATLPETVTLHPVPDYDYHYAYVNQVPVLVDPGERRIVYVLR